MKGIELILFDLGGVLIDIDYQATENAFVRLGVSDFHDQYTQFQQNQLFDLFETGKISAQHFINKLLPITQKGTSPNEIVHAWNAMIGGFPNEKILLLERLSKKQRIALLSNTNELHMVQVKRAWEKASSLSFESLFEQVFLSHEIQQRKPDAATFHWVCEQLYVIPEKVLFIDDSPQHIAGASSAGLQTHFYENPEDFYALFS
ncbi:MAG: HAD family phosphatase [Flavobacteriia bacterium]|jgi:putative hydrolase of the HAD superfamily